MKFLKKFGNYSQYEAYTADTENFILPNISLCANEDNIYYNPWVDREHVINKFNITDISNPVNVIYSSSVADFTEVFIDNVQQESVSSAYTFDTVGEHTVKYTLASATTVGDNDFRGLSSLVSTTLPYTVTTLGTYAFQGSSKLESIEIPNNVTRLSNNIFSGCTNLARINSDTDGVYNLPKKLEWIGGNAFNYCKKLTQINIPSGVTEFFVYAFNGCVNLKSIDMPDGLTTIGEGCFNGCGLTSCTVPSGVTELPYRFIQGCTNLESITLPSGITTIGNSAFYVDTKLKRINSDVDGVFNLPSAVTRIATYAFRQCSSAVNINVPSGVTSIEFGAFYNCTGLTSVTINATIPPTLGDNAFTYTNNCPIYVPSKSVNLYKSATNWSGLSSRIQPIT